MIPRSWKLRPRIYCKAMRISKEECCPKENTVSGLKFGYGEQAEVG